MIAEAPAPNPPPLQVDRVVATLRLLLAARRQARNANSQKLAGYHDGQCPGAQSDPDDEAD
jgi:hypothetical protein